MTGSQGGQGSQSEGRESSEDRGGGQLNDSWWA